MAGRRSRARTRQGLALLGALALLALASHAPHAAGHEPGIEAECSLCGPGLAPVASRAAVALPGPPAVALPRAEEGPAFLPEPLADRHGARAPPRVS